MFNKIGTITLGKLRGISYKLGLVKIKIENAELSKIPQINLPEEYREWHPGKEKEIEERKGKAEEYKGKALIYSRRDM